jgi:hypothetical protein
MDMKHIDHAFMRQMADALEKAINTDPSRGQMYAEVIRQEMETLKKNTGTHKQAGASPGRDHRMFSTTRASCIV